SSRPPRAPSRFQVRTSRLSPLESQNRSRDRSTATRAGGSASTSARWSRSSSSGTVRRSRAPSRRTTTQGANISIRTSSPSWALSRACSAFPVLLIAGSSTSEGELTSVNRALPTGRALSLAEGETECPNDQERERDPPQRMEDEAEDPEDEGGQR